PGEHAKKTMFANSGAEAVENAVKLSRYHTGRDAVVVFDHAFHGRTLLAMSLTAKVMPYKRGFGPFAPEVYRLPYSYPYRCPTGRWFGIEHEDVVPDVITTAKALGSGFPIGGMTAPSEMMDEVHVGGLGGTFGGNPVACAAALASLDVIERDGLIERAERIGE